MEHASGRISVWRRTALALSVTLLLIVTLFIEPAYPDVPVVMPCRATEPTCTIHVPGDALTIQAAINRAREGDTIQVAPGLYREYLIVDKGVTLRGAGEETAVWNVMAAGPEELLPTISVDNELTGPVTLEDMTVILPRPSWCMLGEIENICREDRPASICPDGISVRKRSTVRLHHVGVMGHKGVAFRGPQGIRVGEEADATLEDTTIRRIEGDGLSVEGSAHVALIHAEISGNWLTGLRVEDGGQAVVRSSVVLDNGTADPCRAVDVVCSGIHIADRAGLALDDVVVRGNADWGVSAQLECCGFATDCRPTQVMWQGPVIVEGNNTTHNHDGYDNPGDHPFSDIPDGQVCLP